MTPDASKQPGPNRQRLDDPAQQMLVFERQLLKRDNVELGATNYLHHGSFITDLIPQAGRDGLHCIDMAHSLTGASESELGALPGRPNQELTAQVYAQLRRIAEVRLSSQRAGHTLQATALVHEAFLKLQGHPSIFAGDRGHFYRVAAEAMRQILIDHARSKACQKRGGVNRRAMTDVANLACEQDPEEILALEEAIRRFEKVQPRSAEVVKLRFFAGLSVEETADVTGLSVRTVNREWKFARAWLFKELG
jgi:RNA polymerase sigma factor (TIGR02999 family)